VNTEEFIDAVAWELKRRLLGNNSRLWEERMEIWKAKSLSSV